MTFNSKLIITLVAFGTVTSLATNSTKALNLSDVDWRPKLFKTEKSCEKVEKRIESKIEKFEKNKENHVKRYNHIKEKIQTAIDKAKENDKDTTELEADLASLDELITKFAQDYVAFIDKLKESQNYSCGESDGQFKTTMDEAKELLKTVRQDAKDIKSFIESNIKLDIRALRRNENANENEEN